MAATGRTTPYAEAEVTTGIAAFGEEMSASPGSETLAWMTRRWDGNPGGAVALLGHAPGSMPDNRSKGGRQMCGGESDRLVVPTTAGNAARGKEATA